MYIGYDLQTAVPGYLIIDDISSGFNGSATSFALLVGGVKPTPMPASPQQVLISVNGVVQEPDPTGSAGFTITGDNIVFSSAPTNGHAFFGIVLAGADYANAGGEFPDGSLAAPSFTFANDNDTGWYRTGSGAVSFSSNGTNILDFTGNGLTVTGDASLVGDSSKSLLWDKSDGQLEFADNAKAVFGTGGDAEIYHSSADNRTYIRETGSGAMCLQGDYIKLQKVDGSEDMAVFKNDGGVELFYDNVKTFETIDKGGIFRGTAGGDGELHLYADAGSANADLWRLKAESGAAEFDIGNYAGGSWERNIRCHANNAVELYHDDTKRIETTATGGTITGALSVGAVTATGVVTAAGLTCTGYADFTGLLSEACTVTAGKLSDNTNLDAANGNVFLFTTQETTTCTPNIRWNGSTTLNSKVNVGDMIAITVITTAAAGGYSAQLTIDGAAVTENWIGGSAPSAGGSSGKDIYSYTIVKTADATFTIIGNLVKTSS